MLQNNLLIAFSCELVNKVENKVSLIKIKWEKQNNFYRIDIYAYRRNRPLKSHDQLNELASGLILSARFLIIRT